MKKCVFIVPYFGKLPNYFSLFLKSCENNPSFDWLILTDDETNFVFPNNVHRYKCTFKKFRKFIQAKFSFQISLNSVQKLCDYKPTYGYILERYLSNYRYWGYCDIDLIFGDLGKYLNKVMDAGYDKIFELGHCTIFKNTKGNNRLFMKPLNGVPVYKHCFMTDKVTTFDEVYGNNPDVNDIFLQYGKKVYRKNFCFDVQPGLIGFQNANYDFYTGTYLFEDDYWQKKCVWLNGHIFRLFLKNNEVNKKEYSYIHLQDRKMHLTKRNDQSNNWLIIPNAFVPVKDINNSNLNVSSFRKLKIISLDFNSDLYYVIRLLAKIKHKVCKSLNFKR